MKGGGDTEMSPPPFSIPQPSTGQYRLPQVAQLQWRMNAAQASGYANAYSNNYSYIPEKENQPTAAHHQQHIRAKQQPL
jgi:hypothetical protein